MITSIVCLTICLGVCLWLTFALKGEDADPMFYFMDFLFLGAIVWFALNLKKS
jgi:hypothetical protein